MNKKIVILLVLSLTIALAGCTKAPTKAPEPSETKAATTPTQAPTTPSTPTTTPTTTPTVAAETMIAVDVGISMVNTTAEDGTVLFQRTNQRMQLWLNKPEIAEKITNDFLNRVDIAQDAAAVEAAAKAAYTGNAYWVRYFYGLTYNPQRIDQKVLSFYGDKVKYTGAAHAEISRKGANYDLATGDVLTLASIMTTNATTDDFCKLVLDGLADRAEGDFLREGYAEDVKRRFNTDTSRDENWYFTTTGLCFFFDPYEIAPYTSGVITVVIPYEKLDGLLHPDYLPAERVSTTGAMKVSPFTAELANNFNHTAELIMNPDGQMYFMHAQGSVQDIRITFTDTTGTHTVFAANSLSAGEAIMLQANSDSLKNMELIYASNGKAETSPIILYLPLG